MPYTVAQRNERARRDLAERIEVLLHVPWTLAWAMTRRLSGKLCRRVIERIGPRFPAESAEDRSREPSR